MRQYQNYINGQWQDPLSGDYLTVINPATEREIGQAPNSGPAEVDQAVQAAKDALPAWKGLPAQKRADYVEAICKGIENRVEDLTLSIVQELGTPYSFSKQKHVLSGVAEVRALLKDFADFTYESKIDQTLVVKEPIGVVACITPWNYPLNQILRKMIPAILAGNTTVVKPASDTPLTALILGEIIDQAGLPAGVVNIVTGGGGTVGTYLADHPDVGVISFTGSTNVGKSLYENAKDKVKHLVLELGGKSALVYLEGGHFKRAVEQAAANTIQNSGQTCTALTRLLIPEDRLDEACQILKDYYEHAVVLGDPMDRMTTLGPVISAKQQDRVLNYIQIGLNEGADVLVGGQLVAGPGYYIEPTVFVNVTNDMRIAQEEIFGPVLVVITYQTVEEAIEIANDSPYGLSGAVVGPQDEAIEVAKQIQTGNVYINDASRNPRAPFGGYKESGLGYEIGLYAVEEYLEVKSIFI